MEKDKSWKGKIPKFCASNEASIGEFIDPGCTLHIHHHLASKKAEQQIAADLDQFQKERKLFTFGRSFSYVLPAHIVIDDRCDDEGLTSLLRSHYDSAIEDEHTGTLIWYGYKQCGLPLVLEHNTPNNSVALLWAESEENATPRMKPLFMRRKRHSSHG